MLMLEIILQSFSFIPHTASEELMFYCIFANFAFWLPCEPNKLRGYKKKKKKSLAEDHSVNISMFL